jgi:hypothetical protein
MTNLGKIKISANEALSKLGVLLGIFCNALTLSAFLICSISLKISLIELFRKKQFDPYIIRLRIIPLLWSGRHGINFVVAEVVKTLSARLIKRKQDEVFIPYLNDIWYFGKNDLEKVGSLFTLEWRPK